jgi:hypothetical protein
MNVSSRLPPADPHAAGNPAFSRENSGASEQPDPGVSFSQQATSGFFGGWAQT